MNSQTLYTDAVTGAFSYTGKYIARRLLDSGRKVVSLTGHPERQRLFDGQVQAIPYQFEHPEELAASLRGVDTLYNTYWVRFDHGKATYDGAVRNSLTLFEAARRAGVRRLVHVSISNPSLASPLPYFKGKALLEQALMESGLSYAIIRPTVIFGLEDILINNIAYLVRRFPLFAIPGDGQYRLQPIYVEDMAELCVQCGAKGENMIVDAVGPDIFTFAELVQLIGRCLGYKPRLVHLPPTLTLFLSRLIGLWVNDVVLTGDEVRGLMADLLISDQTPSGKMRLEDWLTANADQVGKYYAAELERHYRKA